MKASIKINYAEATKGQIFQVEEISGKRITLNINGRKVDFGFSEVQLVAPTTHDLFYLGQNILLSGKKSIQGLREVDVTNFMNQIVLPIKKNLMRRAINYAIWAV